MVQTPGTARSEAKRTEILRRAAGVFRRKGFHGAGMRDIARALNMAPGALYYYFESKEDLLYGCQVLSLKRLIESARGIAASGLPADEKLERLMRSHLACVLNDLGGGIAHVEFHALPEPLLREVVARRDEYEAIFRGVVSAGVEAGQLKPLDSKLAALTMLGALNWTVIWWDPKGKRDLDAVAAQITGTFLGGLRK